MHKHLICRSQKNYRNKDFKTTVRSPLFRWNCTHILTPRTSVTARICHFFFVPDKWTFDLHEIKKMTFWILWVILTAGGLEKIEHASRRITCWNCVFSNIASMWSNRFHVVFKMQRTRLWSHARADWTTSSKICLSCLRVALECVLVILPSVNHLGVIQLDLGPFVDVFFQYNSYFSKRL